MFSRLISRKSKNIVCLLSQSSTKLQPLACVQAFHTNPSDTTETKKLIEQWDACTKKYYGPERDTKNFPHPTQRETHEDVRLGFIPKSWFDAFYDKTGVSGPYVFLGGLATYCMSKEIMVQDHAFFELLAFYGAVILISKKWGKSISKFAAERAQKMDEKNWDEPMAKTRAAFEAHSGEIDGRITQEGRHKYVFDAQRENVDLQLEARYRERVGQVYNAVKKRLDYQVELVNTKKRFEQQHMVDWIVQNVVKGITPQQEKDAITSCITNLKTLAKSQPAV